MMFILFLATLLIGMFIGVIGSAALSIYLNLELTAVRPQPYPGASMFHPEICVDPNDCEHTRAIPVQK
jgi:hypothetical protein